MNEFFTYEFLSTFTGMIAFVTATTQIIKYYVAVDPKWVALFSAVFGQIIVQLFYFKDFSAQGVVMALINVIAVLLGAIGAFETIVKPIERNKQN